MQEQWERQRCHVRSVVVNKDSASEAGGMDCPSALVIDSQHHDTHQVRTSSDRKCREHIAGVGGEVREGEIFMRTVAAS